MGAHGPLKKQRLTVVKGAPDKRRREQFIPAALPEYHPDEPDWPRLIGARNKRVIEDAHSEWVLTVTELERRGMIARTDVSTVVDYCICHARVLQCERKLSTDGFLLRGERGVQKNPVSTMLNQWRSSLQKLRDSLGLSPRAFRALNQEQEEPPADDSDLDEVPPV